MNRLAIRILTLAMLSLTLAAAPVVSVVYAAPDNDPPPPDKKKKKSSEARPGIEQTAFADGYRAAYAAIVGEGDRLAVIAGGTGRQHGRQQHHRHDFGRTSHANSSPAFRRLLDRPAAEWNSQTRLSPHFRSRKVERAPAHGH